MERRIALFALAGTLGIALASGAALLGNGSHLDKDSLVAADAGTKSFTFDKSTAYSLTSTTTFRNYYSIAATAERYPIEFSVAYSTLDDSPNWTLCDSEFLYCFNSVADTGVTLRIGLNGITSFTVNFECDSPLDTLEYSLLDAEGEDVPNGAGQGSLLDVGSGTEVTYDNPGVAQYLEIEYIAEEESHDLYITSLTVNWSC